MKIAFLIQDYDYHGGAQKTATLAKQFQLLGHDVTIIAIRCKESDFSCRPKFFSNVLDLKCTNFISSVLSLTKLFRNSQYEIFICIGGYSNLCAGLAKFFSRSSLTVIGSENFAKSVLIGDYVKPILRFLKPLFKFAYTKLNGLFFVSDKLRLEFLKKNSWHPSRCITIYNPIRSLKKNILEKKKKDSGIIFLGVGVLEERKRFDLLLKSFSLVAKPNDKLLIAGTGPLKDELINLSKNLKIHSQVNFLGYVEDIEMLMSNSDILVLTSNSEAFGMVLVEGLAAGMQVVSTNSFSGPAEVLGNGRYGFLAEVNNVNSIASSMKAAIETPKSQEIIYEGASRFSLNSIVKSYMEFIERVLVNKGRLNSRLEKINITSKEKQRKKILINISIITPVYRGMSIFTNQIVQELIKSDDHDYVFVSGNKIDNKTHEMLLNSEHSYKQINMPLVVFDQIVIPFLIKKYKPNICWFPANTFPLILNKSCKYIITIHDLIFFIRKFKIPNIYQKIASYYRVVNLLMGIKRINKITSVSKTMMQEISLKFFEKKKINENNVLTNSFIARESYDEKIFKKLNLNTVDKYFYSIVGNGPHKNLNFLIESFNKFSKNNKNYKLVISGAFKAKYNNLSKNIIFTKFISEDEKISLIKKAELFIFPSLVEGFGIPLIEGLFYNSNVLVSDIPIFREIGKNMLNILILTIKIFLQNIIKKM